MTKKDESLRNFHWCLIRTLHNYPFLTDGKSINNFSLNELAGNQHRKLDLNSWYFQGIPYNFPLLVWYAEYKKERQITMLTWYGGQTLSWTRIREPYHPSQQSGFPIINGLSHQHFQINLRLPKKYHKIKTTCLRHSPVNPPKNEKSYKKNEICWKNHTLEGENREY